MKVVITGGAGKAGRAALEDLGTRGFEVRSVDLVPTPVSGVEHTSADLANLDQTIEVLRGADAVAHMAAIPAPGLRPDGETFRINTISTYNIFSAAAILGIKRVVWASSETLFGLPFDNHPPHYAPIDENHPLYPESHYALSKLMGEAMAPEFVRRHQMTILGLRFSNIMLEPDYSLLFPPAWEDPHARKWNLWGYIDHRDVAQSIFAAVIANISGAENYIIAAADTCMTTSSADLMSQVFPQSKLSETVSGYQTLLSYEKAKSQLGFSPRHSWRDYISDPTKPAWPR